MARSCVLSVLAPSMLSMVRLVPTATLELTMIELEMVDSDNDTCVSCKVVNETIRPFSAAASAPSYGSSK